jgi:tetratricopeptide (TPR) repeat protein
MELKNELELIEKERNVYRAVEFIEDEKNQSLDNFLRVLFVLLDFLVDGQYTQDEHEFFSTKIKEIFSKAKLKFSSNYDFLFFVGVMIYVAEWYFGIDNIDEAKFMLEDALKSNPDNIVYKWGYYSITDQRAEVNTKIKQLISNQILRDNLILEWLKSKGLLGEYILGIIQSTYEATQPQNFT